MPTYANRVAGFGTTIFAEINNMALKYGAVNLGQGRPDFDGPQEVVEAAVRALQSGSCNQYAPGRGIPELTEGIASHAAAFYNMDVDPESGVLVTPGATEAIFCSIMGLVDPGDEVIVIEPFYDSYVPAFKWPEPHLFTCHCIHRTGPLTPMSCAPLSTTHPSHYDQHAQ